MKGCRSIDDVRSAGAHLVAQLRDMLEIDEYELLGVRIRDRQTGREYAWEEKGRHDDKG
nr:MAG TPA: hypothetical protein [Caudoviricetes sp.]